MDRVINLDIIKNPFNWLIIFAIVGFASYAAFVVWNAQKNGLFAGAAAAAAS